MATSEKLKQGQVARKENTMNTQIYTPEITPEQVVALAKDVNGRARKRIVGETEAQKILDILADADADVTNVRVYSRHGFVANSYRYPATIRYFYAQRRDDGTFVIGADETRAQRAYGAGALVTVNGHAA